MCVCVYCIDDNYVYFYLIMFEGEMIPTWQPTTSCTNNNKIKNKPKKKNSNGTMEDVDIRWDDYYNSAILLITVVYIYSISPIVSTSGC